MNHVQLTDKYVLVKTGSNNIFFFVPSRTIKSLKYAKKFNNSNDAIDYMLQNKLLDTYSLRKIGDL